MSSIGRISEFNPYEEDISSYLLRLKHFFKANEVKDVKQVSILITVIGPKILAVLTDLISPKKIDEESYDNLSKILEDHYSPKRLVVAERYTFYSRCQKQSESIAEFVVAVKHLASTCDFGTFLSDALRDNLSGSVKSKGGEPNLTLGKAVEPKVVSGLKQKYASVFKGGPGEIKDVEARIVLKEDAVPKFCKYRPVPYALRKSVEDEIDRMIAEGIAYPVTSSQWATPIVVIQKKSGVRLCGDFKVTLNQVIQSEHYPLPQPEDIFATLAGCSWFSVLDLEAAYLQLPVAEESQPLLTLTTHKGLVRLRRLPYGLSSAPALFQAAMDKIIGGLPGSVAYLDDVLVGGSSQEEALSRLESVLQRLQSYGVKTDHAPLVTIFGNKRGVPCVAAARLQRWALILSAYSFEVKYRRGLDLPHADALSRLPLPDDDQLELDSNYISHVSSLVEAFDCFKLVSDLNPITAKDIARLTDTDPVLTKVRDFIWHGWRDSQDSELVAYFRRRDELSVENQCVLWGSRVVVPEKLRSAVIQLLHDQHPGINRMKMLARSFVWWPGIDKTIEETVLSCHVCQCTRNAVAKVPLCQWPRASSRWQRIHVDYAEDPLTRQQMLIVVDSFSKWLEVFIMKSTTSFKTIEKLRTLFASFGLPEELVSDNGPNFASGEFREFLSNNGIKFTLSPPYHPASNGAAERFVQEVKKNLKRQVMASGSETISLQHKLDNFLFAFRNTPSTVTGVTPAELFLQWKPRTKLTMLKPCLLSAIDKKREAQKEAADNHRGSFRSFVEGERVLVKSVRQEIISWIPGRILERKSPSTYVVSVLGGKIRFCHADHLRSSKLTEEEEVTVNRPVVQSPIKSPENKSAVGIQTPPERSPRVMETRNTSPRQQRSVGLPKSPATHTTDEHPEVQPSQQCSQPSLRRSQRTVQKPKRLDL
ncbi:uncharacterized protein K02A2.6-like [Macrosteles quadrilineatus]|uniref:uncharacterized protein K02A2.6-like n=1 Tax=Macrosteles quadrilineatus TaxID=74068 RepID=UPI0023E0F4EB|nr:uncharacterized protein K02A2.6-like [Macrosteles quadrilineatus]